MADDRMRWKGRFEFVFSSFGYTVGLGNLWRFPQRCYSNGGGVFLIPYLLCVILCAIPTLLLEFSMGQINSEGFINVWKFSPLIQGIGWAILFNLVMCVIYYNVILMYSLYYMLVSFVSVGSQLPWSQCRPEDDWSTAKCHVPVVMDTDSMTTAEIIRASVRNMNSTCVSAIQTTNGVTAETMSMQKFGVLFSSCKLEFVTPEEEYWTRLVLGVHESSGFDDLGAVSGRNAMLLFVMWLIVYYCCMRGIRSIAKVVYITATFPFALLLILLVRGITLEGHAEGIKYYMQPDWSQLSDLQIWSSGATQAIYSLGVAYGSQISLASHNKPNNNVLRDAILIGVVNSCVSIFGGFVVFAFLGHASYRLNEPVDKIFDHGPGILFISYVQGISQLPGASFWSFLFFLTVFTFGLDSQFVMVWSMYDGVQDVFPEFFRKRGKWILIGACLILFILSLPHVTVGGIHLVVLMDRYTSDFTLVLFVVVEMIAVCWIYGINRFISDLEQIIGTKPKLFWMFLKFTWMVSCPAFAVVVYITATFPFALLLIMLVRGITLEGHFEGIKYYMQPDWSQLSDLQIWSSGATQAIYSLGVAYGSQISLASHNKPNNNVLRDAILIGVVNSCVSIFGGFVVFAFLGHASYRLNEPVDKIFDHGPGILFISYVQGISQLPGAPFWCFLFFLTVFTFGLDTQFVMVWTIYDSVGDVFPQFFKKRGKWILIGACLILFILSLPHVTMGGIHLVVLMDRYTSDFTLVLFVVVEMIAVCWIYGINRFISDLEQIIGTKPKLFWIILKFTWMFSCPAFAIFILIASAIGYTRSSYDGIEVTPGGEAIGWLMIVTPVFIMVAFGGFQIWRRGGVKAALRPLTKDEGTVYFEPSFDEVQVDTNDNRDVPSNGYISPIHDPAMANQPNDITNFGFNQNDLDDVSNGYELDEASPPPTPCESTS